MLSVAVLWPAGWTAPAVRERTVRPDPRACSTLVLLSIAPVQGDWLRRGWQSCRGWMQVRREARAAELVRLKAIHAAAVYVCCTFYPKPEQKHESPIQKGMKSLMDIIAQLSQELSVNAREQPLLARVRGARDKQIQRA